ncbi:MBL fold metallo-hydrolase [Clostridium sp. CM028]|uniref:MBL fold metallo-hydrolase n=1 Tax=unclassified Clostridium TaxID=2614128 RepID=UPI001C0D3C93|nr:MULTISPECIES: MBL fold metallo-hydrolase [unclassified Clostridium]MBU3091067.1 MBL fold metallo-hydrolase [Clostridium sp. CF011]MBW9144952.1 MBL fold metallo-hydrolase [Clostridium sp. CM027]MBW9148629.1 MBL fold metallo-hydrolase [Clostridium sp. CM028]UVE40090.1 MBL fold metallo-hydrolase [Clostridium sp. CM027]WAG71639.1 MBL fold metallo-hydrolase [Clostridium sp. CF011]
MIFCPLYSGSSGNSIFVASENTKILVDAGMPGKSIESALKEINQDPNDIDGIFITHEHSDHIKGAGIISRRYNIPIYANENTWEAMKIKIGKIKENNIKIINNNSVDIKDMHIINYNISHDAAAPIGYALYSGNKKACIATDLGYFSDEVKNMIKDADVILLESNHDVEMVKFGPYPYPLKRRILSNMGHLSNDACGKAIVEIMNDKQKHIFLGHLSKTNNYPDLAYQTVVNILKENHIEIGRDISLNLARRDMPSDVINF